MSFLRRFSRGSNHNRSGSNDPGSSGNDPELPVGRPTPFGVPGNNDDLNPNMISTDRPSGADSSTSATGVSLFTQSTGRTASTAATSLGSSTRSSNIKRSQHDDRLKVVDTSRLSETHQSLSSNPAFKRELDRDRDLQGRGPSFDESLGSFVEPVPMPISMVGVPISSHEHHASSPSTSFAMSSSHQHHQTHHAGQQYHSGPEVLHALDLLGSKVRTLDQESNFDNAGVMAGQLAQLIRDFVVSFGRGGLAWLKLSFEDDPNLNLIMQVVLRFTDILLQQTAQSRATRMHLLRVASKLADIMTAHEDPRSGQSQGSPVLEPRNFALGSNPVLHEQVVLRLVETIAHTTLVEKEGAYVAPVLRGFSPKFSVATLCIGVPGGIDENISRALDILQQSVTGGVHVYGRKDFIRPASTTFNHSNATEPPQPLPRGPKPPFRVPSDPQAPPMAVSLATENAQYISGTLGGYIYPISSSNPALARNTFALTCAHVCMSGHSSKESGKDNFQVSKERISVPSPVLIRIFRKALAEEQAHHSKSSLEYKTYADAIERLDSQPPKPLGELIWGERAVVNGALSDLAVIQCLPSIKCKNTLGDDLELLQYDPSLILGNIDVTSIASVKSPGLTVFKYGSTSKFTKGVVSSARMVYWSYGKLQTSEFAVRGQDSALFATGGDSGAWILAKNPSNSRGLQAVGMLHSYDGEFKEFGLYTHMETILQRLRTVTGISWGVVGVPSAQDPHDSE